MREQKGESRVPKTTMESHDAVNGNTTAFNIKPSTDANQTEGELDLARVVRRVASPDNFSKCGILEFGRVTYSVNAVSAKSRVIKVRVIQDVEELRAKLQTHAFSQREILE